MKIALVAESIDPRRGGLETSTSQIAESLVDRGCDVTVLCRQSHPQTGNVKVIGIARRGRTRRARLAHFLEDVRQAIAADSYQIVHAMLPVLGANIYQPRGGTIPGQIAGSIRRWKRLGWLRKTVFEPWNACRGLLGRQERKLVADPTVTCLAVSQMVAEEFARFYHRREAVRVVYNGVAMPEISPTQRAAWRKQRREELSAADNQTVFLTVAGNLALKGVGESIRALAVWRRSNGGQDSKLVVVGGRKPLRTQRLAERLGVAEDVYFIPPTEDIFSWYAAADACILLSWYDPCSRTVLEAVSMGLPAITTVYNGAAEILSRGAGIVVGAANDTDAVVKALEELSDPQQLAARRDTCQAAAGQVSLTRHVEGLLAAYREVCP